MIFIRSVITLVAATVGLSVSISPPVLAQTSNADKAGALAAAAACTGARDRRIRPKIVNGWPARASDWPGFVSLRITNDRHQSLYLCGGTLISPNWIVSAAHCYDDFDPPGTGRRVSPDGARLERYLLAASNNFSGAARVEAERGAEELRAVTPEQVALVEQIILHPDYRTGDAPTYGNDIALVRLAAPWPGPYGRLSIDAATDPVTPPGARVMVGGFGLLDENGLGEFGTAAQGASFVAGTTRLQEVDLPTVDEATCRNAYPRYAIGDGQICAGYPDLTKDSCTGDSGGPLLAFDRAGCPYQVGIVSWGIGCARPGRFGIYSRVSHFMPFIRTHVTEPILSIRAEEAGAVDLAALQDLIKSALSEIDQLLVGGAAPVALAIQRASDGKSVADGRLRVGQTFTLELRSPAPGRVVLFDVDAKGTVTQIFPNGWVTEKDAGRIAADVALVLPQKGWALEWFRAREPVGDGRLVAIVVPDDFPLVTLVAAPARVGKGIGMDAEPAPLYYVATLLDQIYNATRETVGAPKRWGYLSLDYEIVR
jgi:secreted trypsin-like serine protease